MAPIEPDGVFLRPPDNADSPPAPIRTASSYNPLHTFTLPTATRTYTQQFSDLYFSRLTLLKAATVSVASEAWANFKLGNTPAQAVDRVLDVRQGDLCWVVGTCFVEMPLKPNVLEDVGREHWIAAPASDRARKFFREDEGGTLKVNGNVEQENNKDGFAQRRVMLEDESGRLRLAGEYLGQAGANVLITGAIMAVLGTENADGEFEVLDVKVPDLARQPQRWERDDAAAGKKVSNRPKAGKIALVSGLGITGDEGDAIRLEMLSEYLLGETGGDTDAEFTSSISRLMILGNSLSHGGPIPSREELASKNKGTDRKYGYDSASYNAAPTDTLDDFLAGLLPSIPITLQPGDTDPTQTALPQQPLHAALFPRARNYMPMPAEKPAKPGKASHDVGWFHSVTNPWDGDIDGWRVLTTGGQPITDMCRYIRGEDRIELMESTLRWRVIAPTCPDTLWCYPFQEGDAFVQKTTPHVYIAGNQPRYDTDLIEGPQGQQVRLIAVPKFKDTGQLVLLDAETLEPEVVHFDLYGDS